jgi:hypothetical protein
LAIGEDLDDRVAGKEAGHGGEIQRVAACRIAAGKRERSDGVKQIAA